MQKLYDIDLLNLQISGEPMSENDVQCYITANEIALRRHYTIAGGQGMELEFFPWFVSLCCCHESAVSCCRKHFVSFAGQAYQPSEGQEGSCVQSLQAVT